MKVLFLVIDKQTVYFDSFYDAISDSIDCDIYRLNDHEQLHLRRYFKKNIDLKRYGHILLMLKFKRLRKQARFLRQLPNLTILEHDATQNYMPSSKYQGRFSSFYRKLPGVRYIHSSKTISQRLCEEGFDSVFLPKGFDQSSIDDWRHKRDIELGFIGSLGAAVYAQRYQLLKQLAQEDGLQLLRTQGRKEYAQQLNRIRYFISADIDMHEYMLKNFEAMAAGCLLFTWDQGELENQALGFHDMNNVVLYHSIDELRQKLDQLRKAPELAESIRQKGYELAHQHFSFKLLGQQVATIVQSSSRLH